jgi:deazaflavin-dependent oxidoreductase (nitroreductase family)
VVRTVLVVGLVSELGYSPPKPTVVQRWIIGLASTRVMSVFNRKMLPRADRLVVRLTRGKATATSLISGLPTLWLTTIGARSGRERSVPLLGFPRGDDIAVIGTGFGQRSTPGWVHNLEARGEAVMSHLGVEIEVHARLALTAEAELIWEQARRVYPGYANYATWAQHRTIRVFVLEKAVSGGRD